MKQPPFKCPSCRKQAVYPVPEDYVTTIDHDGRSYAVTVPGLPVLICKDCGNRTLDYDANKKVSRALRVAAGLLQPEEIRSNREQLKLTQKTLAERLGIAEATLSRWETGAQIQQRAFDKLLRVYFNVPECPNSV
jgi:putative zinc finger/helix-turn-helix YgiT family protein